MTAENNFNVEPVPNVNRVVGSNPSGDQKNKKRQLNKQQQPKEQLDDQIEKQIGENNPDIGDDFHVIDYRA